MIFVIPCLQPKILPSSAISLTTPCTVHFVSTNRSRLRRQRPGSTRHSIGVSASAQSTSIFRSGLGSQHSRFALASLGEAVINGCRSVASSTARSNNGRGNLPSSSISTTKVIGYRLESSVNIKVSIGAKCNGNSRLGLDSLVPLDVGLLVVGSV